MTFGIAGCSRASLLSAQGNLRIICLLARQGWARRLSKPIGADNCCLTNLPYRTVRIFRGHRCQTTSFCASESSILSTRSALIVGERRGQVIANNEGRHHQAKLYISGQVLMQTQLQQTPSTPSTRCLLLLSLELTFYSHGDH